MKPKTPKLAVARMTLLLALASLVCGCESTRAEDEKAAREDGAYVDDEGNELDPSKIEREPQATGKRNDLWRGDYQSRTW